MNAFKAYDIRGIYNRDFTREDVYRIGYFLPSVMRTDRILVGNDVRLSSPEILEYLTKGITDSGADVYYAGLSTTPMIYYSTAKFGFSASVMITASHNPAEYNGLKISGSNAKPIGFDNGLNEIKSLMETADIVPATLRGHMHNIDVRASYLNFLKGYVPAYAGLKISIDCSNGMAGLLIKELLNDDIMYLYDEPDGSFPNHEANPLHPENVRDLQKHVREHHSDLGVIFDGDADRVMFVDEHGDFISPDLIIAVLAHYFLEEKGMRGTVLHDIRTSKAVGEYIKSFDSDVVMWKVGRAFAATKLRNIDGIFGGELAGHYYFRDFYYSDSGILACLLVIRVVAKMNKIGVKMSDLIAKIKKYECSGEINFRIENKQAAMQAVVAHFTDKENPTAYYDFDGYRIEYDNWWLNIRPSNTEPYLRFIAEADNTARLHEIVTTVEDIIKTQGGELEH